MTEQDDPVTRTCPWCSSPAAATDTSCQSCGAALAQRESIGDLAIPGLTAVDAALQDFDKRPLHLRGPSPSQGMAPALIVGAMAGGPIGLAAIGGVAAVAAAEYLGARRPGGQALDEVDLPAGHVLMREGEIGSQMFMLVSGEARVEHGGREIAVLGPGSHLGEMALVAEGPRVATADKLLAAS